MSDRLREILGEEQVQYPIQTDLGFLELAEEGVTKIALNDLASVLSITVSVLASIVGTSARTISRYKDNAKLPLEISTNAIQLARVFSRAEEVFEDRDTAIGWLNDPNKAMDGKKPIELVKNSFGVQVVLDTLGRIEHGIPS